MRSNVGTLDSELDGNPDLGIVYVIPTSFDTPYQSSVRETFTEGSKSRGMVLVLQTSCIDVNIDDMIRFIAREISTGTGLGPLDTYAN